MNLLLLILQITTAHAISNSHLTPSDSHNTVVRFVTEYRDSQSFKVINKDYCTGVILDSKTILSAAHCFSKKIVGTRKSIRLSYGNYENTINQTQIFLSSTADISIVKLATPLITVAKVKLPTENLEIPIPLDISLVGFGATKYDPTTQTSHEIGELRTGANTIVRYNEHEGSFEISQKEKSGICKGDSGSPALVETNDGYIVVGIANTVEGVAPDLCKGRGFFGDIRPHLNWIRAHL